MICNCHDYFCTENKLKEEGVREIGGCRAGEPGRVERVKPIFLFIY